jgi:pimeloyl-ACP methyl ester carboxylesterase
VERAVSNIDAGMHIGEVLDLADVLRRAADDLVRHQSQLQQLVQSSKWEGPVAVRFKQQWWPGHRNRLQQLGNDLRSFAQSAANNAAEQRRASDAAGSSSSGGFRGHGVMTPFPMGVKNQTPLEPESKVVSFDGLMRRGQALPAGEFEILRVSDQPPKYIVNLRGIDLTLYDLRPEKEHLQDLAGASVARLTGNDAYAQRVALEMQRAGIPPGSEVMIVGHSAGAIAAMNLARDRSFNQPGNASTDGVYHVQVTHVLAAGAGLRDWVDDPPPGTSVLMAINRNDVVARGIQTGDFGPATLAPFVSPAPMTAANAAINAGRAAFNDVFDITDPKSTSHGDGRLVMEFSSNDNALGGYHDYTNYERGLASADSASTAWMDQAAHKYFTGGGQMQVVRVAVPDNIDYGPTT